MPEVNCKHEWWYRDGRKWCPECGVDGGPWSCPMCSQYTGGRGCDCGRQPTSASLEQVRQDIEALSKAALTPVPKVDRDAA